MSGHDRTFAEVQERFEAWQGKQPEPDIVAAMRELLSLLPDYRAGVLTDEQATHRLQELVLRIGLDFYAVGLAFGRQYWRGAPPPA